jgi:hypothetical protein
LWDGSGVVESFTEVVSLEVGAQDVNGQICEKKKL